MTLDDALIFLREHQPLADRPPRRVFDRFRAITDFLYQHPDPVVIPLLVNAFGMWEDETVAESAQSVLRQFSANLVVPHLRTGMVSKHEGVRFWSADTAAYFPDQNLLPELTLLLHEPSVEIRLTAARALEKIHGIAAKTVAQRRIAKEPDAQVGEILKAVLLFDLTDEKDQT